MSSDKFFASAPHLEMWVWQHSNSLTLNFQRELSSGCNELTRALSSSCWFGLLCPPCRAHSQSLLLLSAILWPYHPWCHMTGDDVIGSALALAGPHTSETSLLVGSNPAIKIPSHSDLIRGISEAAMVPHCPGWPTFLGRDNQVILLKSCQLWQCGDTLPTKQLHWHFEKT